MVSEFCFYGLDSLGFRVRVVCVCVCEGLLLFCKLFMRSAFSFLYTSCSEEGRCDLAVSALRARFSTQFLGLQTKWINDYSEHLHHHPVTVLTIYVSENDMQYQQGWTHPNQKI